MKKTITFTTSILGLALVATFWFSVSFTYAQHDHQHDAGQHGDMAKSNDKVRCAFDGMMMKAAAMVEVKHDGKTHHFCNAKQAERFKAHPDKYLKQIAMGHVTFNLNLLTVDEYKQMMGDMGMGSMMKMDAMKGKTHRISLYTTQHNREVSLGDIELALQITDAAGKAKTTPLEYNKMMKTYDAYVAVPSGGKHQVRVLVTTPGIDVSM